MDPSSQRSPKTPTRRKNSPQDHADLEQVRRVKSLVATLNAAQKL
eukprot:SAG31_NODE_8986_length_1352_cov_7.189146_1_plen_44_part_01